MHGGKANLAKTAKGGRSTREMDLVVNSSGLVGRTTFWMSGWEGCDQWGVSGAISVMIGG